jgi:hypothetical protein
LLAHDVSASGPSGRTDLDIIPREQPTLGEMQVTDVIQTLFQELKAVRDIETIRTVFSEPEAVQVNEFGPVIP